MSKYPSGVMLSARRSGDQYASAPSGSKQLYGRLLIIEHGAARVAHYWSNDNMSLQTWWLFVMMTFVVSATPGPNMLLVMSSSARFGFRAAVATMAGCMTALLAMMSISAAGLGALLQAFPMVFDTLRWAGAAYLAYLG